MSVTQPLAMFSNWTPLGGYVRSVSTAFDRNNDLFAFGINGSDNTVCYRSQSPNGTWGGWMSLGGYALSITAVRDANGNLDVFAIGGDHALYCNSYTTSTTTNAPGANLVLPPGQLPSPWSGWKDLGGYVQSISAVVDSHNQLNVFAVGGDDAVYYNKQSLTTGSWSGWSDLLGYVKPTPADFDQHGNLQTIVDSHGNLDVFAIGSNNAVWYRSESAVTGAWGNWTSIGGNVLSISTCRDASGKLDVFAIASNLGVWESSQSPANGLWSTWKSLSLQGEEWLSVNAATDPNGGLYIYAIDTTGTVEYQQQLANGNFSGWTLTNGAVKTLCLTDDKVRGDIDVLGVGTNNAAFMLENATYSPAPSTDTLFGANGPSYLDVQQGQLDDCWLLASLAEVAARAPSDIKGMFTYEGTTTDNGATVGLYKVRFYNQSGVAEYVQVDTELPNNGVYNRPVNNVLWVALAEKAYAQANGAGYVQSNHVGVDDYAALCFGQSAWALQAITGKSAYGTGSAGINTSDIATAWNQGQFIVFNTTTPANNAIVEDHVYALVGYNASSSQPFELFNPWGTSKTNLSVNEGSTANGTATVLGFAPNSSTTFGLFWADSTFVQKNYANDSLTSGAAAMTAEQVMTKLASARGGLSEHVALAASFSGVGAHSSADAVFSGVGTPSNSNLPRHDGVADVFASLGARPAAEDAAMFVTTHGRIPASDALFTDFGSI
jgi:hypothetical protein